MVLTYTAGPPDVVGSVTGGNGYWYGEWTYDTWLSTGTSTTDQYQWGAVDLSTLTGATQVQVTVPFLFGSASNVKIGYDVGIGWAAAGGGALSASAAFDPMESLTGVQVFGANGAPITSFTITDSNGTQFGPNGVVPEPHRCGFLSPPRWYCWLVRGASAASNYRCANCTGWLAGAFAANASWSHSISGGRLKTMLTISKRTCSHATPARRA
jgi:hypothetical protein